MVQPNFSSSPLQGVCSRLKGGWRQPSGERRDLRGGQAYTEYAVILFFGVFVGLGIVALDSALPEVRIMSTLYGYIFDYYAGLANFLNLPIF